MKWLLVFFTASALAQNTVQINENDYSFNHPTCLLRFDSAQDFSDKLKENLVKRGFKLHDFIEDNKLNPEDLYLSLSIEREGIFFKDCKLHLKINQAVSSKRLSSDKTIIQSQTTRTYPRVTFDGDERCTRGIDDLFVNVPKCESGKSFIENK